MKNIFALLLYISFVVIFLCNFFAIKTIYDHIKTIDSEKEESESGIIENDILDSFYTENNINLNNILLADDNEVKEKLVNLLNNYRKNGSKELIGDERRDMLTYYDNTLILGDSQVAHIRYSGALEEKYLAYMPGLTLLEQLDKIDEHLLKHPGVKKIILWNGFNIFGFKDSKELIDAYKKVIEKIHSHDKDIKIYVCSLLPARNDALYKDLENDARHDIYKGPEYDQALKEYFGKDNTYININFLVRDDFYTSDGVHFDTYFNYMLVPYLAYYTNLSYEKSAERLRQLEDNRYLVATNSIVTIGSFFDIKRDQIIEAPLRFKILENNGKEITCISYDIIDEIPYDKDKNAKYKDSYIRKFLTEYIYNSSFTSAEKKIMRPVYTEGDINDYITILSIDEYNKYIDSGFNFATDCSNFAHTKIDKIDNVYVPINSNVWLRDSFYLSFVHSKDYSVMHVSYPYNQLPYGVRPVIKLDIKEYLKYLSNEYKNVQQKADYISFYNDYFETDNFSAEALYRLKSNEKTVLLTFDDGPSYLTSEILDLLDKYDVKATFFICEYDDKYIDVIQRMINSGHTVGVHCYTHFYDTLYTSVDSFVENMQKLRKMLKRDFGIEPKYMRFPGGTANELSMQYNTGIMTKLVKLMHDEGYEYYDWNVTSGDANPQLTGIDIFTNVKKGLNPFRENIVLLHDSKEHIHTYEAFEEILKYLKEEGYTFKAIDDTCIPFYKHAVN